MRNLNIENLLNELRNFYPSGKSNNIDPYFTLIKTIISQRTRDENTDITAKKLFSKYLTQTELANAKIEDIEKLIKSVGFYRQKANRIKEVSKIILEKYEGKVPNNFDELMSLPGVGRKTANCVIVYGFGKPAIPVDTHVHRISNRIGIVNTKNPDKTEEKLKKLIPPKYWIDLNEIMVKFGKDICKPIGPNCDNCPNFNYCSYPKK